MFNRHFLASSSCCVGIYYIIQAYYAADSTRLLQKADFEMASLVLCYPWTTGLDADDLTYVYNYFSGLKGVDTIIGICFIVLGIFALVTRFILADFKKAGPTMYIGMLAANIVLSIAYYASVSGIVGGEVDMDYTSTYSSIVASVVLLICNIVYFKKRKHLFNR